VEREKKRGGCKYIDGQVLEEGGAKSRRDHHLNVGLGQGREEGGKEVFLYRKGKEEKREPILPTYNEGEPGKRVM